MSEPKRTDREMLDKVTEGFRRIGLTFPYLAGLIAKIDVQMERRLDTAGVFASGRLVVNPDFVAGLTHAETMFVLTHELLHLTLRTHDRGQGSDPREFNYAHDAIINDVLCHELQVEYPPANGVHWPGARLQSAEALMATVRDQLRYEEADGYDSLRSWWPANGDSRQPKIKTDVLDADLEREWFPDLDKNRQQSQTDEVVEQAARSLALQALMETGKGRGHDPSAAADSVAALRGLYRPSWELALQRWLESVAPSDRSYARPSRRGADRRDVVLPGRKREGWMLHVILDTSGSMAGEIPRALGAIADFCEAMGAEQIRLLQCDAAIAADETLTPAELARWTIKGYGGSDLVPAMERLASESGVQAAVVLTDGDIGYPAAPVPYQVLWVLPRWANDGRFAPGYGKVMTMN